MRRPFRFEYRTTLSASTLVTLVQTEAFMDALYARNGARSRRVIDRGHSDVGPTRTSRIELERRLPRWIRAAIGETFGYFDYSSFDSTHMTMVVDIVPLEIHPKRIQQNCGMAGAFQMIESGGATDVVFAGEVKSDLPMIGSKVAGFLYDEVEKLAEAARDTTHRYAASSHEALHESRS